MTPAAGGLTETPIRTPWGVSGTARDGWSAMTDSISAASATVVVIGPFSDRPSQESTPISAGTTPKPGLIPNSPQLADGIRIDPAPSLPCAIGTIAAATAAADPPEDPPAVWSGAHGLRLIPYALSENG